MRLLHPGIAILFLSACAATPNGDSSPHAGILAQGSVIGLGQTVPVGNLLVTPLQVTDDSRCPSNVQCVWQGRFAVLVRVEAGASRQRIELVLNEPQTVEGGTVELVEVLPLRRASTGDIEPSTYRMRFSEPAT